jgi:hypothetical protein
MKTDWSNYSITYDGITYDLQYRDKVNLIACEDYTPNSPSPDYPSPIVSIGDPSGIDFAVTGYAAQTYSAHRDVILRSLPDGTCDTYDALTGAVTRNVGVKVFDGTESGWAKSGDYTTVTRFYYSLPGAYGDNAVNSCLSSHFKSYAYNSIPMEDNSIAVNYSPRIYLKIANTITGILSTDDGTTRVTKLKAWLAAEYAAGTPVTVFYKLAEPVIESVDPIALPTYPRYTTLNCSEQMTAKVRVVDIC